MRWRVSLALKLEPDMRRLVVGDCLAPNRFQLWDPDAPNETEFEALVVRALTCLYQDYHCILFGGTFRYDDLRYKRDLALIARDSLLVHSGSGACFPLAISTCPASGASVSIWRSGRGLHCEPKPQSVIHAGASANVAVICASECRCRRKQGEQRMGVYPSWHSCPVHKRFVLPL